MFEVLKKAGADQSWPPEGELTKPLESGLLIHTGILRLI
jgi:hypothetical protein